MDEYNDIARLPGEMLTEIFSWLPTADLKNAVMVSKKWSESAENPSLWASCLINVSSMLDLEKTC